ncbi:hypothetical protein PoB_007041800 [Plakobranchus ocellatus]|uniref:Uncharacterized protein n=1 Tax=Plakobranchus ocellatus TaxID=259542 RepID=A0AAV4DIP7_9GAST|nr:hypothetical protein PoB_007041800 [Plakobranchus ocellatus]
MRVKYFQGVKRDTRVRQKQIIINYRFCYNGQRRTKKAKHSVRNNGCVQAVAFVFKLISGFKAFARPERTDNILKLIEKSLNLEIAGLCSPPGQMEQSKARQGKARKDKESQDKARHEKVRHRKPSYCKTRQSKLKQDKDKIRQGKTRQGKAKTRQGKVRESSNPDR